MMLIAVAVGFVMAAAAPTIERRAGRAAGWLLAAVPAAVAAWFAYAAVAVGPGEAVVERYEWAPAIGISLAFRADGLSLLLALLVSAIGALVLVYGGGYLAHHPQLGRFYALTLAFMASMLGLVLAENLFLLYVFWEFTTISSYLLIGFDHDRPEARKAATQALVVTFLGGLGLLAGAVLLQQIAGTVEITALRAQAGAIRAHPHYGWAVGLVLAAAFTKSAQFPFHFWLPNAMEAPTPVSAYLHSATMVKAGVFLLARMNPILGGTPEWSAPVATVGAITMVLGAWLALFKTDLKQILAYTTVSVLGVLTFLIGMNTKLAFEAMMGFLVSHALYKGALFLAAGSVQHEAGSRDLNELGGLARAMPATAAAAAIAAASMAGLPPTFGFIAKELFYEAAGIESAGGNSLYGGVAVFAGALLFTSAATVALRPFFGGRQCAPRQAHEAPAAMWIPAALLAAGGLLFGLLPGALAPMVGSAALAGRPGDVVPLTLHLFHGWTPVLGLSAISVAAGAALYAMRDTLATRRPRVGRWGPARLYDLAMETLHTLAGEHTRTIQSGRLRYYLLTTVVALLALVGATLARTGAWPRRAEYTGLHLHEAALVVVILMSTMAAVRSDSRLAAVASLGVVGLGVALIFALVGAPDVAITLIAAETLTVILLLLVLYHLPTFSDLSLPRERFRDAVVALSIGAVMGALVLVAPAAREAAAISRFFIEASYPQAHGRNVVNVILTDFRSFDTLGEITVLAVAGGGVYALLRLRPDKRERE